MPKTPDATEITAEIVRILDGRGVRPLNGHIVIDRADLVKGAINARVLHAHDSSEVLAFGIEVTVS